MGKKHTNHRVVVRIGDKIISNDEYEDFAAALPHYERRVATKEADEVVTLQHGVRITRKSQQ